MTKGLYICSALAAVLTAASACTVHNPEAPGLSGPSEFALSIDVSATPDSISQDGASQATIIVTAHDVTGALKSGVTLRLSMLVNGVTQDFGTLSARTLVSGSDGKASAIYTAPPMSPLAGGDGTVISIGATPIGTNAQTASLRKVDIRLVPPGVILPPASTPTALFTVTPTPVNFNVPVSFDASLSCPGPLVNNVCPNSIPGTPTIGSIVSYSWNFGDGTTGSGKIVSHTFAASASSSFTVTLTVTNDRSLQASATQALSVSSSPAPAGDWTSSPAPASVGDTIFFNAEAVKAAPGHSITQYNWNFGDGATASGFLAQHIYAVSATYTVTLSVTDDTGQKVVLPHALNVVTGNPVPGFSSSVLNLGAHRMLFDASATTTFGSATITSYQWTFGDTTSGSGPSVTHDYPAAGTYTVTLTITDSLGRVGRTSVSVTVP